MNRTRIEWVRNPDGSPGYTWNPITGCLNHTDGLCKGGNFPCYAFKLANGRLRTRYTDSGATPAPLELTGDTRELGLIHTDPFYPRFWEARLAELTKRNDLLYYDGASTIWKNHIQSRGIFVCDMGDLFGIPEKWTERVLDEIWGNKGYDRFYLLTKQAQELIKWSPFPENCWVGVTVTNADMYLPAMEALDHIDAKVKYVSFEPLLENPSEFCEGWFEDLAATLDWLIIGACTGSKTDLLEACQKWNISGVNTSSNLRLMPWGKRWTLQPKIEWVQEIVEAADKAGIPVFLKDNLAPLINWPQDGPWAFQSLSNMLRQEMPSQI